MKKDGTYRQCGSSTERSWPFPTYEFPAMSTLKQAGEYYTNACGSYCLEVMRFANERMQEDLKFLRALTECSTYEELAEVQQGWVATASQAYVTEGGRLLQLMSENSAACMGIAANGSAAEATV